MPVTHNKIESVQCLIVNIAVYIVTKDAIYVCSEYQLYFPNIRSTIYNNTKRLVCDNQQLRTLTLKVTDV